MKDSNKGVVAVLVLCGTMSLIAHFSFKKAEQLKEAEMIEIKKENPLRENDLIINPGNVIYIYKFEDCTYISDGKGLTHSETCKNQYHTTRQTYKQL